MGLPRRTGPLAIGLRAPRATGCLDELGAVVSSVPMRTLVNHRLWTGLLTGLLTLFLAVGCSAHTSEPKVTAGARLWAAGPVRWLMLPEEARRFRRLTTNRQALEFIDEFWRRRDPTPGELENPLRVSFFERAAAADRFYGEKQTAGSLTDRGRALILLGHPPILRTRRKAVPHLGSPTGNPTNQDWVRLSVWAYPIDELAPRIQAILAERKLEELTLTFVDHGERTTLLDGERLLKLIPRALVRPEAMP